MIVLSEFAKLNKTFVVAHRGASETEFENTLAAFGEAITSKVTMIEIDVQVAADKEVVVFHDNYLLDYNTNKKIWIGQLYSRELKQVYVLSKRTDKTTDTKYYVNVPENKKSEYFCLNIPTLKEVVDLVRNKTYLIIEIKSNFTIEDIKNAEIILFLTEKLNYAQHTLFASFDTNILKRIKEINPLMNIAVIKNPYKYLLPTDYKKIVDFQAFICSIEEINDEIEKDAKMNNVFLGLYSADNLEQLKIIKKHNVRAVVTNYPKRIFEIVKESGLYRIEELI